MQASDEPSRGARDSEFELVTLRNGTRAVRHLGHGEVMHPSVGPSQEACALYVEQSRLSEKLQVEGPPLQVWDVGLGAGTNAVAALTCARELGARQRRELTVVSFEIDLSPLRLALADTKGFPFLEPFAGAGKALLKGERWSEGRSRWELRLGDAASALARLVAAGKSDLFRSVLACVQPCLWTPATFAGLRAQARSDGDGCTLFTYSAATPTRVLTAAQRVLRGPGVATGMKKETTVAATQRERLEQPLDGELARTLGTLSGPGDPWPGANGRAIKAAVRGHAQF